MKRAIEFLSEPGRNSFVLKINEVWDLEIENVEIRFEFQAEILFEIWAKEIPLRRDLISLGIEISSEFSLLGI